MRTLVSLLAAVMTFGLSACVKPASGPPLCGEGTSCAEGTTCVVGRCRLAGSTLVGPSDGQRIVLAPDDLAVTSSRDPSGAAQELPAVVVLGRGSSTLYLHFAVPIHDPRDVTAAVLVLEPPRDAIPPAVPIAIHVAPILESWRGEDVTNGRAPRSALPERAGVFSGAFGGLVRIDVTSLVKRWAERRADDHGLVIVADESDAYGAAFSLGVTEGRGPHLEVYLR
ncbi:MAG TPA: hypothetical protein PK156_16840 [Polyangium sp.]|nr:hypothetical protein [Polyangium sp.]